jgi:hypothetical protein
MPATHGKLHTCSEVSGKLSVQRKYREERMKRRTKILLIPALALVLLGAAFVVRQGRQIMIFTFGGSAPGIVIDTGRPVPACASPEMHDLISAEEARQQANRRHDLPAMGVTFDLTTLTPSGPDQDSPLERHCKIKIVYSGSSNGQNITSTRIGVKRIFYGIDNKLGETWLYRFGLVRPKAIVEEYSSP